MPCPGRLWLCANRPQSYSLVFGILNPQRTRPQGPLLGSKLEPCVRADLFRAPWPGTRETTPGRTKNTCPCAKTVNLIPRQGTGICGDTHTGIIPWYFGGTVSPPKALNRNRLRHETPLPRLGCEGRGIIVVG